MTVAIISHVQCQLCRHEIVGGAFGFSPAWTKPIEWTCSVECAGLQQKFWGKENIVSERETQARQIAGEAGGRYLDSIGKTDLADLSPEEWQTFIDRMFETFHVTLVELAGGNKPPF